jgi:hypothetical protein
VLEVVVVYFDGSSSGLTAGGAWQLKYDAQTQTGKPMPAVHTAGSGKWKEVTYTITDAHFGQRGAAHSDLSLHLSECVQAQQAAQGATCPDVVVAQVEVRQARH